MRVFSPRSVLIAAVSFSALAGIPACAAPAMAQEAGPPATDVEEQPVEPAPDDADDMGRDPVEPIVVSVPGPPAIPAVWSPTPRNPDGRSAYGLYLAGRSALISGEGERGAAYLAEVQSLTPEQPRAREQAFTAALLSGDLDVAARIAPEGEGVSPVISEAGRLVAAVQAFAHGQSKQADDLLRARPIASPHARAGAFVQGWIAAAAGDWDRAMAGPGAGLDPITTLIVRANRASLLELRRRHDEAEAEYRDLNTHAIASALFQLPYGEFLERRGKREEALAVYEAALTSRPNDRDIAEARDRVIARGRPPAAPNLRQGAARALRTAADIAIAEQAREFAVVYLRLAQNIDYEDAVQLQIGRALMQGGLESAARAAFARIEAADPAIYAAARIQSAVTLEKEARSEEALAQLQAASRAMPDDPATAYAIAGQLLQMKRYEDALSVLEGPLLNTAEQGFEVRFLRGAAYESLGRVPEAEAELWAALQAQPDNPTLLNYLGYLWVDSGTRVEEGAAMIARAHAADPEDGNIQDSLGWAQFRQGRFEEAVATLEEAVVKLPANAEINDHLGDAYWAVGRRREAGFQWSRVLTLDADPERRAEVERKLAEKLGPPPTVDIGAEP